MASVGQLAAGVAHEINNPIGYVHSNLGSLEKYLAELFQALAGYEAAEAAMPQGPALADLRRLKEGLDLEFLKEDIPVLMRESKEGISRVRKIVQDLKDFSRVDSQQQWEWTNLHRGIDSTLNIVSNEIKYCADVVKEYGEIPDIECLPSQLNQVFMNLLVNAGHAIEGGRGTITIRSAMAGEDCVRIEVTDTGKGIPPENLQRIFDPFFTTKPIGKGTGLGLSLSYGIVQKHGGRLEVRSTVGQGTTFSVVLPVHRAAPAEAAEKEIHA
jgi:signal transduction histidine kinase